MNQEQQIAQTNALHNWLRKRLEQHRALLPSAQGSEVVTVVAYHFWNKKIFDPQFDLLESAIRETWHHCGMLKTVLVVNNITRRLEDFAAMASGWVKLDLCPDLVPGNLYSMSVDCISRLHLRVDSDRVLIVQNDGFPLRSGLDGFLGNYDYIGAPWAFGKDDLITRLLLRHRYDVGNGGFSLRSKRLCEMSAWYYQRKYKLIPYCYLLTEDYFVCKTLPSFEKRYRETIRIAPPEVAAAFSLEDNIDLHQSLHVQPFGFHGASAFQQLLSEGQNPAIVDERASS
jgi:hypothetical protein